MSTIKTRFKNDNGHYLSAKLELPDRQKPHNYAIFAHCFTCSKNLSAVRNIARSLNDSGIAVLRFDFTGLGESEGDFSETGFSSNVQDLVRAAEFLDEDYEAPTLLVGHSLGGAAVIFAASQIASVKSVATIGAPSSPAHVQHLFRDHIDKIKKQGSAEVSIGGRPFQLSRKFIEDLSSRNMESELAGLGRSLIVLHSPQDAVVGIENAREIYQFARHPKSYISLDGADHLLSSKEDSAYVGSVIAGWSERYLDIPKVQPPETHHQVAVSIGNEGYTSEIAAGKHLLIADEPEKAGGDDFGPSPYEYISAGLGACTAMTLRMYSDRKNWDLQKVVVHLDHKKDYPENTKGIDQRGNKIDFIKREIELVGNLDDSQRQKLLEIADKCPVHKTLSSSSEIETTLRQD
ncbi:MAG: bifunctional alpha/beta hydrolase/OsmC family protein [Balneolaceae bacterium]